MGIIERRQILSSLAVAACDGVRTRVAISLVKSFIPRVVHAVNTVFIISVSNSLMFTYHHK